MNAIRAAVIGVGYLGQFHAENYGQIPEAKLVAVVDTDQPRCAELAEKHKTRAVFDYREILDQVDAVSIVVPTCLHYEIAKNFLEHGVHVLLEKPITTTIEEADDLIRIAAEKKVVLQTGHLERFNPAVIAAEGVLRNPRFIEATRIGPFKPRGTDVNIVLDLMIHDIDLILTFVGSPVREIRAVGAPVLTDKEDIANVRLEFENGCAANITASRVSFESKRKMQIFQSDAYISIDFQNRKLLVARKEEITPGNPFISADEKTLEAADAIRDEIRAFLHSIASGAPPKVTGEDGRKALELALMITNQLKKAPL